MLAWLIATLHLLALGVGLGAVVARSRALGARAGTDGPRLPSALLADTLWGIAALVWIVTGLWRLFGDMDKVTAYYFASPAFHTKMGLLGLVLLLELWPMATLVRWRIRLARGQEIDLAPARAIARIGMVQALLVVAMVFAATGMARGIGS